MPKKGKQMKGKLLIKEISICIIIVVIILIFDNVTQKYIQKVVEDMKTQLSQLEEKLENKNEKKIKDEEEKILKSQQEKDLEKSKQQEIEDNVVNIKNIWNKYYEKLAYFIEHDELEKVKTNLISMESFSKSENYQEALSELDINIFILEHIQEKYKFSIQNIF